MKKFGLPGTSSRILGLFTIAALLGTRVPAVHAGDFLNETFEVPLLSIGGWENNVTVYQRDYVDGVGVGGSRAMHMSGAFYPLGWDAWFAMMYLNPEIAGNFGATLARTRLSFDVKTDVPGYSLGVGLQSWPGNWYGGTMGFSVGAVPIWAGVPGQFQTITLRLDDPLWTLPPWDPFQTDPFHPEGGTIQVYFQAEAWNFGGPGTSVAVTVDNLRFSTVSYNIHAVDVKSGQVRQITHISDADAYNPSWSNDGRFIVHDVITPYGYASLYITEVSTAVSTPLVGGEYGNDGAWSPDGKLIAFDYLPLGYWGIYVVPPAGGFPTFVRDDALDASWSPDSKHLVFQQPSDGSIRAASLTGGPAQFIGYGQTPAWSPSGQFIVYTDWSGDLWKIGVNQKGVPEGVPVQLTNDPSWENQPTWSVDSKTIIFHSTLGGPDYDIWRIPAVGGTPQILAGFAGDGDYDPCASVDGRFVAYAGVSP